MKSLFFVLLISGFLGAAQNSVENTDKTAVKLPEIPDGFPEFITPDDNPFTEAKFQLGRYLFYDTRFSRDSTIACAHCHIQAGNFSSPGQSISLGIENEQTTRNVKPLVNLAFTKKFLWGGAVQGKHGIEDIAFHVFSLPNEYDLDTGKINERLRVNEFYKEKFEDAFGKNVRPDAHLASYAIATFVRGLISGNSPYDEYIRGDKKAMNESAVRGMKLFFSDRTNCSRCHSGPLFKDEKFHNTGVTAHYFDRGRYYITGINSDRGKFLTPTLRNIAVSGPYMHKGELPDLKSVIEHYNRGGYVFINKDTLLKPLNLTFQEKQDLIAFLHSLTDQEFLSNKRFAKP